MGRALIEDAFAHHAWATEQLLHSCRDLRGAELEGGIPGGYGTVMATLRHLVEGDRFQLWAAGGELPPLDASAMGIDELLPAHAETAGAWGQFLARHSDANEPAVDVDDGGWKRTAPIGIRVAQALDHGTEHRTQVCAGLAVLGIDPPDLSGWAFGAATGVLTEVHEPR